MSIPRTLVRAQRLERDETRGLGVGPPRRPSRWNHDVAVVLAVALSYFAGTRIGFALTSGLTPIAFFWPPNAILLAAFLLAPVRLWWAFLLALTPLHFLAQINSGIPLMTAFGWLLGNAGEALLGATLILKLAKRATLFHSAHGVTCFLIFGFAVAPLVTSFLDAAIVVGTNWGHDYWNLWITRVLSNMLAQLTIVPLIVVIAQRGAIWIARGPQRIWLEAALMAAAVALVSLFVFRADTFPRITLPALIYLPLPLLLWAAMRFGPAGVSAALLTISLMSIHSLMHGRGPFMSASMTDSARSMQVFLCMVGVPLLLLAAVATERRRTERSLRETSRKLIDAQEQERQRIARELHDDIGQTLTLAEIELDHVIAQHSLGDAGAHLNKLSDQLTMMSQTIWELSHGLYPSNLEILGLVTALTRLCTDLREETSLQLHCETTGVPDRLPADVSLCLYRVAQEALRNVVRHSQARHASLRLRMHGGRLLLQVVDDGVGFNPSLVAPGLGFASMRERLKALNGALDLDSTPGRGTTLEARVVIGRQAPRSTAHDSAGAAIDGVLRR